MKTFRTYQLAKAFYHKASALDIKGPMRDQFRRASLSIVLNLGEGSAKPTSKDRKRFYFIALGSLREVQCMLDIMNHRALIKDADILAAHLYRLCHT